MSQARPGRVPCRRYGDSLGLPGYDYAAPHKGGLCAPPLRRYR